MEKISHIIDKLKTRHNASKEELLFLLNNINKESINELKLAADSIRKEKYGKKVFSRGLLEFSNYCKRNCVYCGLRKDNKEANRYRLNYDEIFESCQKGYSLGYKTFVLQGGEDPYFTDDKIVYIVKSLKEKFPDAAITLSIGEKSKSSYKKYFKAGADRYLLRHETADKDLYNKLHPKMEFDSRARCLKDLKEIGYQVGAGFMVGIPGQKNKHFVKDLLFLKELKPEMVGIGPFLPQSDTPLKGQNKGSLEKTLILLSIIRLLLPDVLLPATTAVGTVDEYGRENALLAGANVVMPNVSPINVREKYKLYDGKICIDDKPSHCRHCIEGRINSVGFELDLSRGDNINWEDVRNV